MEESKDSKREIKHGYTCFSLGHPRSKCLTCCCLFLGVYRVLFTQSLFMLINPWSLRKVGTVSGQFTLTMLVDVMLNVSFLLAFLLLL